MKCVWLLSQLAACTVWHKHSNVMFCPTTLLLVGKNCLLVAGKAEIFRKQLSYATGNIVNTNLLLKTVIVCDRRIPAELFQLSLIDWEHPTSTRHTHTHTLVCKLRQRQKHTHTHTHTHTRAVRLFVFLIGYSRVLQRCWCYRCGLLCAACVRDSVFRSDGTLPTVLRNRQC